MIKPKMSQTTISKIQKEHKAGASMTALAKKYHVSKTTILRYIHLGDDKTEDKADTKEKEEVKKKEKKQQEKKPAKQQEKKPAKKSTGKDAEKTPKKTEKKPRKTIKKQVPAENRDSAVKEQADIKQYQAGIRHLNKQLRTAELAIANKDKELEAFERMVDNKNTILRAPIYIVIVAAKLELDMESDKTTWGDSAKIEGMFKDPNDAIKMIEEIPDDHTSTEGYYPCAAIVAMPQGKALDDEAIKASWVRAVYRASGNGYVRI